ncbi:response regulator transcription factor [Candidatus Margulisiibacteriota bacterium]
MARKILVIEDNKSQVETIKDNLELNGYSVIIAGDGDEGYEKYQAEKPDLIILDVMLPKLDGYSVARRIRSQEVSLAHVPIIMLTGRTSQIDGENGFSAGADVYLKKPFDPGRLVKLIKKCLEEETS